MAKVRVVQTPPTLRVDGTVGAAVSWQLFTKPEAAGDDAWSPVGPRNDIAVASRDVDNVPPGSWMWGVDWRDSDDQDSDKATTVTVIEQIPPPKPAKLQPGTIEASVVG